MLFLGGCWRWNLGLALQRKRPFKTFCYLMAPLAPATESSGPLASASQAASIRALGYIKNIYFRCTHGPLHPSKKRSQVKLLLPKFIETESTSITTPRSSGAAAGSLWLGVSTGIRLPAGLSAQSPALDGSAVTPHNSLRDLRLL